MKSRIGSLLVVLLWTWCGCALAQEVRALISGTVRDPSGSAIPEATVSIKNVGTNLVVTVQGGPDGTYFIPQLPVGTYELSAEAKGFKKYIRERVTLNAGDEARVDIAMEIGSTTESVTVTSELTGIESNQSVMGQTLTFPTGHRRASDRTELHGLAPVVRRRTGLGGHVWIRR